MSNLLSVSKALALVPGLQPFPKIIKNSKGERVLSRDEIGKDGSQRKEREEQRNINGQPTRTTAKIGETAEGIGPGGSSSPSPPRHTIFLQTEKQNSGVRLEKVRRCGMCDFGWGIV